MNRKNKYQNKRKSNKIVTFILLITSLVMTAAVVWLGVNNWDVNKSLRQLGLGNEQQQQADPEINPDGEIELDDPAVEEPAIEDDEVEEPVVEDEPESEKPDAEKPSGDEPATETPAPGKTQEKPVKPATPKEDKTQVTKKPPVAPNKSGYIEGQKLPDKPTYVKGILIANKTYPMPSTFAPGENKEAREAFEQMAAEAKLSGFNLTAFSTYRAYDYQVTLYNRYAKRDGVEAADRYSARPGYSEHQTGLAFDIGEVNYEKHWASSSFGDTEAGKWVFANASRYGFILRYPKGKEDITGYMHEAWHYRYIGKDIAEEIFKNNITLEEYLGLK